MHKFVQRFYCNQRKHIVPASVREQCSIISRRISVNESWMCVKPIGILKLLWNDSCSDLVPWGSGNLWFGVFLWFSLHSAVVPLVVPQVLVVGSRHLRGRKSLFIFDQRCGGWDRITNRNQYKVKATWYSHLGRKNKQTKKVANDFVFDRFNSTGEKRYSNTISWWHWLGEI